MRYTVDKGQDDIGSGNNQQTYIHDHALQQGVKLMLVQESKWD